MKKYTTDVLITGATGFVGTHLILYLNINSPNNQLHALVRNISLFEENRERYQWDASCSNIGDLTSIKGHTYIHLAGKAHDLKNLSDEQEYFRVNFELTQMYFDHFVNDPSAKKFIFISSVKAVADSPEGIIDETVYPEPVTAYGRSKLKAEEYILKSCPPDKSAYILRPCMIHGPGNKGNLNLLYNMVVRGYPWPLGAYHNSRSFLSVENLCFTIRYILEERVAPGIYNVADSQPLSTNRLVELIAELTGIKSRIWKIPKALINTGAKLGNVLPLPIDEEKLQKLTHDYVVSNRKLIEVLGCDLPVTAEQGMRYTLTSFIDS